MIFLIPLNDTTDKSVTYVRVNTGSTCARTNKRVLRSYLEQVGVPTKHVKRVLKALGFWGNNLSPDRG